MKLNWQERLFLILMGIPAFGLALIYTLVTTYLPYFLEKLSSASIAGILIGSEGIFALFVPSLVGLWSDTVSTHLGSRLPFFFAGGLLTTLILLLIPISSHSLFLLGIEVAFFFTGYFTMYEAYYALYPDLVPKEQWGRSQGILGGLRSLGMLLALVGGGVLIEVWMPLPFYLFIIILGIVTVVLYFTVRHRISHAIPSSTIDWLDEWNLVRESKKIQLWLVANICWEIAVSALRVFIVLYFTQGLKLSLNMSSASLGLVGLSAIIASPFAGYWADKYGYKHVIMASTIIFAFGLLPPLFTVNKYFLLGILPVAFAAVVLMTLPFPLLMGYIPKASQHGTGAALFGFCQGVGVLIGPFTTGLVIDSLKKANFLVFEKTEGYTGMFLVASFFLFLSLPFTFYLFGKNSETYESKSH